MKDENTWNTICPVCGSPIRPEMALVELAPVSEGHQHQDLAQRGIRLCSKECAANAFAQSFFVFEFECHRLTGELARFTSRNVLSRVTSRPNQAGG